MRVSKSGLFLFELIVVIFLFTISSAVCISIFAKSYSFSTDSEALTMSSLKAQTVAETFKDNKGDAGSDAQAIAEAIKANNDTHDVILSEGSGSYGEFVMNAYFNKNWDNTDDMNKVYTMTIMGDDGEFTKEGGVIRAVIEVTDNDKMIFEMEVRKNSTASQENTN